MMDEIGSFPHNMSNSSPVALGNLLFINTSNGQDETHANIPSPRSPAIIALDRTTGELVWEQNHVGENILHGQWSSAGVAEVAGSPQVIMGEGDGWIRGYVAETGEPLWEFDTNPKDSVWPRTRNNVISTPVILDDRIYIANGQDPEHGEGTGHLYAIDATGRGDITESGRLWHYDAIRRTISTAAVRGRDPLPAGLLRFPPRARHRNRRAALGPRHLRRGLGLPADRRRQALPRRRGRRCGGAPARPDRGSHRRDEHGAAPSIRAQSPRTRVLYIASRNQLFALEDQETTATGSR